MGVWPFFRRQSIRQTDEPLLMSEMVSPQQGLMGVVLVHSLQRGHTEGTSCRDIIVCLLWNLMVLIS